ncbi:recombinase family protein [Xenorhabdus szentirmaii]|uniref:recombinase family protein n=1 Tax=Xenorhabdus szentirmaii TaxID=290112 RepID=UPI000C04FA2A|nr:recombinase family protein [Xenorhabdus szentirmaii]PHM41058.1 putative DNA invertase [Xenorhabdus szentirmaii]
MSDGISKCSPSRVGYARVSSISQNLDSQIDALKTAGCGKIFTDKMTGSRMNSPGWEAAGRAAAKARGKRGGRPRPHIEKCENARILYENSDKTAAEVCERTGVGRRTFFSYLLQCRKESSEQAEAESY